MLLKNAKREKAAKENKDFAIEEVKAKREKQEIRREHAKQIKAKEARERDIKGVKEFHRYIKDVENRLEE